MTRDELTAQPTDKHRETAREILNTADHRRTTYEDLRNDIATALAQAEADGAEAQKEQSAVILDQFLNVGDELSATAKTINIIIGEMQWAIRNQTKGAE